MECRSKGSFLDGSEGPPPSRIESTVQMIVQKQTDTKLTLASQFEQHRHFHDAGELHSLPASSAGLHTIHQLQALEKEAQDLAELTKAGLTHRDISFFLQSRQDRHDTQECGSGVACEPYALDDRLDELRRRVAEGVGPPERQEDGSTQVTLSEEGKIPVDPFVYIAEFAKKFERKRKRKEKRKLSAPSEDVSRTEDDSRPKDVASNVDPSVWHAVVPLQEQEIVSSRLSLADIQQIPRFANYEPGKPHTVLYLKNLHSKTSLQELIALFGCFDKPDTQVKYRMMSGRMRGQAFVHFADVETATKALHLVNGYKLHGQPVVVTFARCKEDQEKSAKMLKSNQERY